MKSKRNYLLLLMSVSIFFLFSGCGGGSSDVTGTNTQNPQSVTNPIGTASGTGIKVDIQWPGYNPTESKELTASLIQPSVDYIKLNLRYLDGSPYPADWKDIIIPHPTGSTKLTSLFFPAPVGQYILVDASGYNQNNEMMSHRVHYVMVAAGGPTMAQIVLGITIFQGPLLVPSSVQLTKTDSIEFLNLDWTSHTITVYDPFGAAVFSSGSIPRDGNWWTPTSPLSPFPVTGTYTYKLEDGTTSGTLVVSNAIPAVPEQVFIKGGTFTMGDSVGGVAEELPTHSVTVSDFSIGKYEMTNKEYVEFLNETGNQSEGTVTWIDMSKRGDAYSGIDFIKMKESGDINAPNIGNFTVKSGYETRPVVYVSWYGTIAYCNWLSTKHGLTPCYGSIGNRGTPDQWRLNNGYRLPTEAEWEYACRGGNNNPGNFYNNYYWGNGMDNSKCWWGDGLGGSANATHNHTNVGYGGGHLLGLYDMSGNVAEWCGDWYSSPAENYTLMPGSTYYYDQIKNYGVNSVNPTGPSTGTYRPIRGGSWYNIDSSCRSSYRYPYDPLNRVSGLGFRLVRNVRPGDIRFIIDKQ